MISEQIRQSGPVSILSIFFPVLAVVDEISLPIFRVLEGLEVSRFVFDFVIFTPFPNSPLLYFESFFLLGCFDKISMLEVSLVGSPASISGRQDRIEPTGEVIELQIEIGKAVLILLLVGVRRFVENAFLF